MKQNELQKIVLPKFGLLRINSIPEQMVKAGDYGDRQQWVEGSRSVQYAPLTLKSKDNPNLFFTFPLEPLVSISGGNKVVKRSVAKGGLLSGTVKERWSIADYDINISGLLTAPHQQGSFEECYPGDDLTTLLNLLRLPQALLVESPLLEVFGINSIVIEDYDFPFTKGENYQAYEISAVSDFSFDLLAEM